MISIHYQRFILLGLALLSAIVFFSSYFGSGRSLSLNAEDYLYPWKSSPESQASSSSSTGSDVADRYGYAGYLKPLGRTDAPPRTDVYGSDKVMLLLKSGAQVGWDRVPIHLATTLTRVPRAQLYFDVNDTMAGYQLIDPLANISQALLENDQLRLYREFRRSRVEGGINGPKHVNAMEKGGWELDKYRFLPMINHAYYTFPDMDWYIMSEGDSFVLWDNMYKWLQHMNPKKPLYFGSPAFFRDEPFAHGGSGIVMSRGLLDKTFGLYPDWYRKFDEYTEKETPYGDHLLAHAFIDEGIYINRDSHYKNGMFQGEPPRSMHFDQSKWCVPIFTFHHLNAQEVSRLFEFEQINKIPSSDSYLTYKDVYLHFLMPFILPRKTEHDNLSDKRQYQIGDESDQIDEFLSSEDNCRQACNDWRECLQWRYTPNQYCGLSDEIILGNSLLVFPIAQTLPHDRINHNTVSGWMGDRIRLMRASQHCDGLAPAVSNPDNLEEGWYFNDPSNMAQGVKHVLDAEF